MFYKLFSYKIILIKFDVNLFNNYYIFYMLNKDLKGKMYVWLFIILEEDSDRFVNMI